MSEQAKRRVGSTVMMSIRALAIIFSGVAVLGASGCSGQPGAPSGLASDSAGNAVSASAVVTTSETGSRSTSVSPSRFGDRSPGVVFVTSQGLYYDTFVVTDPLPMEGLFVIVSFCDSVLW